MPKRTDPGPSSPAISQSLKCGWPCSSANMTSVPGPFEWTAPRSAVTNWTTCGTLSNVMPQARTLSSKPQPPGPPKNELPKLTIQSLQPLRHQNSKLPIANLPPKGQTTPTSPGCHRILQHCCPQ